MIPENCGEAQCEMADGRSIADWSAWKVSLDISASGFSAAEKTSRFKAYGGKVTLSPVNTWAHARRKLINAKALWPDGLKLCATECYPGLNQAEKNGEADANGHHDILGADKGTGVNVIELSTQVTAAVRVASM